MWLIGVIIIGFIVVVIYNVQSKTRREEEALEILKKAQEICEENDKANRRALEKELEARRDDYKYNSSAKIDKNAFFSANDEEKDYLFSKYLVDASEEVIPLLTSIFMRAHHDRNYVEEEVAAYVNFCCYCMSRAADFDGLEYLVQAMIQNDRKGRDDDFSFNRRCIYSEVNFGEPARAHWDFTGTILKENKDGLIACLLTLADFIWEPCMEKVTSYEEYYNQPITVKSIELASQFGKIYIEASFQTAIFIETLVSTAQSLDLFNDREQQRQFSCPLADQNHYIIKRFMSQVDSVIGEEYLQYECVAKLRKEALEQLINAYDESPDELTAFSDQTDHRLWALKQVCKLTLEELGTGKHHLRDVLKPEGNILASVNKKCLNQAYQHGYIDNEEFTQAIKELNNVIRDTGEWA